MAKGDVPQTCYMASVIKRQIKENEKKLILTQRRIYSEDGGVNNVVKQGPQFSKYERVLLKSYEDMVKHFDKGRVQFIEYKLNGKTIIFAEYTYKETLEGFVTEIRSDLYWEGDL